MRKCIVVSSAMLTVLTAEVKAQRQADTTLKSTTIEVIQSYKPEVKQAPRPEFRPAMPPRDTTRPAFKYDIPQQALYYTYTALPLRPLALGKDSLTLPFPGYVKLGGGSQSTLYLDAGIANLKGDNYETAIHLHHLSQSGNIQHQKIALSGIEAEGTLHTGGNAWTLSLEGLRNQYHYYGYDHKYYEFSADEVQQMYTGIQVIAALKNEQPNRWGINYNPRVGAYYYGDDRDVSEQTFLFDIPFSKTVDSSFEVGIGASGNITKLKMPLNEVDNNIFSINPRITYRIGGLRAKLGINPTLSSSGNSFLLPDIGLSYMFPGSMWCISAGWEASLRQNTYRQFSQLNPYIFNQYTRHQTRTDEIYGMLSTSVGNHVTVGARVSWWQYNNLPMFLNDTLDGKNFYLVYDEMINNLSLQLNVDYRVANVLSIGLSGTFNNFINKTYNRVWHEPGLRIKGSMTWKPGAKLLVTAYATILDQIYALNEVHTEVKLEGVFDIGAGAEYQFIPRLSAFINVNNLLNDRYQRWYGYQTYGICVFGGLRFKF